ncbi:SgcJ/EcaC family oxidoreductase [Paenibacillus sp. N1-5-1-14]|uniref:SgcJ/EcaC family oxidoreductase n=1 Tax=Paenibacillus radicibacter TaxID=2972488 RepID=UPI0021593395|nr:SgcJ/EcaC family oxidoreductase [Paenibacillus radicibacter]MCR8645433.1 SgcJ/EcaC family oxidoreductase [Paenibacillus radicibacter]
MTNNDDVLGEESHNIKQIIAEMEAAHNQHDADALDRHFTSDATWVNVMGLRLSGWKQINEVHKAVYAGPLKDSYARYEVVNINFVRSDVAITHIRQYSTTSDGKIIEEGQGSLAVYVMVKENHTWMVAAGQNTLVQEPSHSN